MINLRDELAFSNVDGAQTFKDTPSNVEQSIENLECETHFTISTLLEEMAETVHMEKTPLLVKLLLSFNHRFFYQTFF